MKFSYEAAWNDIVALWRAHGEFLAILAGLFLMIPQFANLLFIPPMAITMDPANPKPPAVVLAEFAEYFSANGTMLFLLQLPVILGTSAILSLLVDGRRPTVGDAIRTSFVMLPSVFALNLLTTFAVFFGTIAFIVPGLYLLGRLSAANAWQMANRSMNPITAIRRSFDLTRGNGWLLVGIILVFAITGAIAARGIGAVLGILISFVIPKMSLAAVAAFLSAILSAVVMLTLLLLSAAIYRQLAPQTAQRPDRH